MSTYQQLTKPPASDLSLGKVLKTKTNTLVGFVYKAFDRYISANKPAYQSVNHVVMKLWKSSSDDMHWQQGKCYIYSWQFYHVLIAVDIMILSAIFVKIIWILFAISPGLFVAPATRGFCVAVKCLNGLEIYSISVHQHSAGAWNIVRTKPSVMFD